MAPDFDIVVMVGDLASIVDGRAQSLVVRKYFGRLQARPSSWFAPAITTSTQKGRRREGR